MNAELLEEVGPRKASDSIAEIQNAARRIAAVIKRLTSASDPHSVAYVGESRMIDLSLKDQD